MNFILTSYPHLSFEVFSYDGEYIYTTIPIDNRGIHFYFSPDEKVSFRYNPSDNETSPDYQLISAQFVNFVSFKAKALCVFEIEDEHVFHEKRRFKRTESNIPVLLFSINAFSDGVILDKSEEGMRIFSHFLFEEDKLEIISDAKMFHSSFNGKIVWKKKDDDGFFYGISLT